MVADSARPVLLFETGLPVRYYLPKTDVRIDLLTADRARRRSAPTRARPSTTRSRSTAPPTTTSSGGTATPPRESIAIAGLVAFYNEKVDLIVDGVRQERRKTKFS